MEFLGQIISDDGIKPDQTKFKAVGNMPDPKNITDFRWALGILTNLADPKSSIDSQASERPAEQRHPVDWDIIAVNSICQS